MEPLEHRLIIFYGSSPGSGKSTLSSWLANQLEHHGFNCTWIYEDDVAGLAEFQTFVQKVKANDAAMIHALLGSAEMFITGREGEEVTVTDSVFPCFNWLLATGLYSGSELTTFSQKLLKILQPLRPIVFFLSVPPELALERAVKQRGHAWLEQLTLTVDAYGCNANKSISSQRDVATFFKRLASTSLQLLKEWETVILDAETRSLDELKQQVLNHLRLSEIKWVDPETVDLVTVTGSYRSGASELSVYRIDGRLYVNTYWPNGCELVPRSGTRFFLKGTSHYLEFKT